MTRLRIVGLKTHLEATVRGLHRLGCVQIENAAQAQAGDLSLRALQPKPGAARTQEELSHLLARLEGVQSVLGAAGPPAPAPAPHGNSECLADARAGLEAIGQRVQALVAQQGALEAELASLPRYEATLRKLMPILPRSVHDPANVSVGVLMNRAHAAVLEAVTERVFDLTEGRAEILAADVDLATRAMLIVIPRELGPAVDDLLGREDISRLRLPAGFTDQPPDEALAALSQRLAAIPEQLADIKAQLAALSAVWAPRLASWSACLRDRLEEFAVVSRLGETDQTFVLAGWAPEKDVPRLCAQLAAEVGEAVVVQTLPISAEDAKRAPVALVNPGPVRPFESLVRLLSLPRYQGVEPTTLMAFFLPIFFGMILGDVGYGAVLLLACALLLRRFRGPGTPRDVLQVLMMGSAWSIVFGFLYGEAFGALGERLGLHALWFERASPQHLSGLLLFTIAVGAVHVTLGLIIGVWDAWRERSRHHLLERGGSLIGLVGLFLIVSVLVDWLPSGFMTLSVAVMLVGIAVLGASLGWLGLLLGPIEFIGVVGNILSYLRIAAIGLASVYLARVANDLAGSLGNVIVGVVVAVLIHALNLALGAFSPTIHSLRLHYVEFFRKFYEGGGQPYAPFKSQLQ